MNVQKFMFGLVTGLMTVVLVLSLAAPTWADTVAASVQPAALFEVHCVGCHLNGGNVVRRGKTLKLKALRQNKVDSIAAIATLIANGKNSMPAYRSKLSEPEIKALAKYVLVQAEKGWPRMSRGDRP